MVVFIVHSCAKHKKKVAENLNDPGQGIETIKEISHRLGIDEPNVRTALKELIKEGIVQRVEFPPEKSMNGRRRKNPRSNVRGRPAVYSFSLIKPKVYPHVEHPADPELKSFFASRRVGQLNWSTIYDKSRRGP